MNLVCLYLLVLPSYKEASYIPFNLQNMIARHWAGVFKTEHAEEYMQHLKRDLFPKLSVIKGFRSASILRKDSGQTVEFLIITNWESMEAIRKFAGDAVVLFLHESTLMQYVIN